MRFLWYGVCRFLFVGNLVFLAGDCGSLGFHGCGPFWGFWLFVSVCVVLVVDVGSAFGFEAC